MNLKNINKSNESLNNSEIKDIELSETNKKFLENRNLASPIKKIDHLRHLSHTNQKFLSNIKKSMSLEVLN